MDQIGLIHNIMINSARTFAWYSKSNILSDYQYAVGFTRNAQLTEVYVSVVI